MSGAGAVEISAHRSQLLLQALTPFTAPQGSRSGPHIQFSGTLRSVPLRSVPFRSVVSPCRFVLVFVTNVPVLDE